MLFYNLPALVVVMEVEDADQSLQEVVDRLVVCPFVKNVQIGGCIYAPREAV